jgi:hypothetical protein
MKRRFFQIANFTFGREHLAERTVRFTKLSRFANAAIALIKIGMGIYSLSLFLYISGFYNVGIATAKHFAIKSKNDCEELIAYGRVGLAITITSILYILYALNMAIRGKANMQYDIFVSLAIATLSFTEIAIAVRGIVVARRIKNLIVEATKRTNLVCSLISLVLTQSVLLSLNETTNIAKYCGYTGLLFGSVSTVIGLQMIWRSRKLAL